MSINYNKENTFKNCLNEIGYSIVRTSDYINKEFQSASEQPSIADIIDKLYVDKGISVKGLENLPKYKNIIEGYNNTVNGYKGLDDFIIDNPYTVISSSGNPNAYISNFKEALDVLNYQVSTYCYESIKGLVNDVYTNDNIHKAYTQSQWGDEPIQTHTSPHNVLKYADQLKSGNADEKALYDKYSDYFKLLDLLEYHKDEIVMSNIYSSMDDMPKILDFSKLNFYDFDTEPFSREDGYHIPNVCLYADTSYTQTLAAVSLAGVQDKISDIQCVDILCDATTRNVDNTTYLYVKANVEYTDKDTRQRVIAEIPTNGDDMNDIRNSMKRFFDTKTNITFDNAVAKSLQNAAKMNNDLNKETGKQKSTNKKTVERDD